MTEPLHAPGSTPASAGNTPLVTVEWDAEGRVTRWPAEAEALFGWRADEVIGKRAAEWPFVHPDDLPAVRDRTRELVRGNSRQNLSVNRNLTRDGRVLHCEWYNTAVVDERGDLVAQLSLVLDVTARERAFAEMQAARAAAERAVERTRGLQRVTAALSEALTPAEVMRVVVDQGLVLLGATAGIVMLLDDTRRWLQMAEHRGYAPGVVEAWPRMDIDARLPLCDAVRSGEPLALRTLEERERLYPDLAGSAVFPAILSVPLSVGGDVLGGLGLGFATEQELGDEEVALATALARQCAQAIRRATLFEAEREARREVETLGARLRLALEAADVGTWEMDPVTLALRGDERCRVIFGLAPDAPVAFPVIRAAMHPDDVAVVRGALQRALDPAASGEYVAEYRIRRQDGAVRWVIARGRALFEGEGSARRPTLLTGTLSDITGRVHARRGVELLAEAGTALAASSDVEGVLRALARIAASRLAPACAVFLAGAEAGAERVCVALRADDTVHIRDLAPAELADDEAVSRLLARDTAMELDGSPLPDALFGAGEWGRAAVLPMRVDERAVGALLLAGDARERWAAEELAVAEELARRAALAVDRARLYQRALAANLAKSQFLATMSHEIRTPINAIVGYAELLELGVAGPLTTGQAGYLARIRESSRHLLGLISDILDLAKVEAGEMRVAREPVSAWEAASGVVAMLLPQAEAKGVRLAGEPCTPKVEVLGDASRIRQVLLNLLSNAVKFTQSGGRVAVRCGAVHTAPAGIALPGGGPWGFIEVADTGIGIAPGEAAHIFEPFTQVDGTHTRQQGGTGLGLAISRGFARRMGGEVTVWSRPGEGSVFTLWLPAAASSTAAELPTVPGEVPGLASVGRVLEERVEEVLAAWTRRIGSEPELPHARGVDWIQLEDHAATFVVEVARSLMALDAGGAEGSLLRDGESIIRTVARLHGAQRARLGFTPEELRLEYRILFEEAARLLRRNVPALTDADPGAALAVAQRVIEDAAEIAMEGYALPTRADVAIAEAHRVIDRSRETVRRLRALGIAKKRKRRPGGAGEEGR